MDTTTRSEVLAQAERAVLGEIWSSDEAYRNLVHLCDRIGARWAGSESERDGGRWLLEKANSYGLRDARLQPFPHEGWIRGPIALRITSPVQREVAAISLPYTPPADLEAEAVWVGEGDAAAYERLGSDACRGKIVVSWAESTAPPGGHAPHRREKFGWALAAGAIGFIFVNQNPGMMSITGALAAGFCGELPSLGMPREAGDYLRRLLADGPVKLHLKIDCTFHETTSHNVLASLGPSSSGSPYLLTGAHYDAHDIAVGATDNASGTVVVLEAMRALKQVESALALPIRMSLFACEEVGLLGAWHYAKVARDDLKSCRFVLNVDSPVRAQAGEESLRTCGFPELVPYFQAIARDVKYDVEVRDTIGMYADHFPFAAAGVPSGTLGSRPTPGMVGRGWGHTPADTVDKVNPKAIQAAAALTARLLLRMSLDQSFPGRHRTREEMNATFDACPIGWYIRQFKRFPFQPPWA